MNDPAVVDAEQAVRRAIGETQLAKASANGEARLVAIVPRLEHANRWPHQVIGVREVADAPQLVGHDALFEAKLEAVVGVLPATPAATRRVVRARRLDAIGRRAHQDVQLRAGKIAPLLPQPYDRYLTRQGPRHEHHAAIGQMAKRFAAERGIGELDLDRLTRGGRRAQLARRLA